MSAEIINLNDTTPAAPPGFVNALWQKGPQSAVDPTTGLGVYPVSAYVAIGAGVTLVQEVPAGVGTGVLTLSHEPIVASLVLVVNGVIQMPLVDYTIAAEIITMTVSTESDDKLGAWYGH